MNAGDRRGAGRPATRRGLAGVVAACAAALLPLAGCIEKPAVELHDVRVAEMGFEKLEILFDFAVSNPNPHQISLSGFDYALSAGAEEFARGSLPRPVTGLSGGQTAVVRAPVTVQYDRFAPLAREARPVPYTMTARAAFDYLGVKTTVRFRHAGEFPALRRPAWHFRDLRLPTPGGAVVELVFDVVNPNGFDLPLVRLRGTLKSGEEALLRVDRVALAPVPAGKTARLVVPVQLEPEAALRAAARAEAARASLRFEGRLRLRPPPQLRAMLLGKKPAPALNE